MASMLDNFNRNNISILEEMGFDISLAANFKDEDSNSLEKNRLFYKEMKSNGYNVFHVDFSRSISNIPKQIKSIIQVNKLLKNNYDIVHCNSPICSVITRIAYRKYRKKNGGKLLYTAHGFHFYDGAPKKNWFIYYPIEKYCSRFTDVLITINNEDYLRAKEKFHAQNTVYIHGIGIDTKKFNSFFSDTEKKRKELGISSNDIMLLSVGELSARKNQSVVIKALPILNDTRIHYFIAGIGKMQLEYLELAKKLGVENHVHLLGYRNDISELCQCSDLYVFPSLQEGLPVALMEAISCKVPVVCSNIRGNTDLIEEKTCLFNPNSKESVSLCIRKRINGLNRNDIRCNFNNIINKNYKRLMQFSNESVNNEMKRIYYSL